MVAWLLIAVSLALGGAAFAGEGLAICALPASGVAAAALALVSLMRAWRPREDQQSRSAGYRASDVIAAFLAGAAALASGAVGMAALSATRASGMSAVTAANLRGIGLSLMRYHEQFGEHAPTLFALVDANLSTRKQLVTPFDPRGIEMPPWLPQEYSSFVYRPGAGAWVDDGRLMLVHEAGPFCTGVATLIPQPGWFVLFATGEVRWLVTQAFEAALAVDRERRKELGWLE